MLINIINITLSDLTLIFLISIHVYLILDFYLFQVMPEIFLLYINIEKKKKNILAIIILYK